MQAGSFTGISKYGLQLFNVYQHLVGENALYIRNVHRAVRIIRLHLFAAAFSSTVKILALGFMPLASIIWSVFACKGLFHKIRLFSPNRKLPESKNLQPDTIPILFLRILLFHPVFFIASP